MTFLLRVEGSGIKSYDDRGLLRYQPYNDGRSMVNVSGATQVKVSGNLIMSVVIDVRWYIS